jgi:Arc/MetJ-type ribon-helix-helix transcriptional regulator
MKTLTVRLPEPLAAQIGAESKRRRITKSDVIRERLEGHATGLTRGQTALDAVRDLIGSVGDLPPDVSRQKKAYLKALNYGGKRHR